jgi:hypothetical protein
MKPSATVRVTVTPEADARIAQLGLKAEADRMIDYARTHLPEVERIEVILYDRYELGDEPGLAIEAHSRRPFDPAEHISWEVGRWQVTNFPPEVLEHLHLSYYPGAPHAG